MLPANFTLLRAYFCGCMDDAGYIRRRTSGALWIVAGSVHGAGVLSKANAILLAGARHWSSNALLRPASLKTK